MRETEGTRLPTSSTSGEKDLELRVGGGGVPDVRPSVGGSGYGD